MVAERKVIDITEIAEPGRLARELGEHPEGLTVGERGRVIGTIVPEHHLDRKRERERELERKLSAIPVYGVNGSPLPDRRMTPGEVEQLLAAVHELAPYLDADQMHGIVEESRQQSMDEQRRSWELDDSKR